MQTDDRRPQFRRSMAGLVLAGLLLALWGGATPGSLPSGTTEPVIDSVTPASAPEGTEVTILGANFGPSVGALQGTSGVSFNGVWSTPTSWSDREIQVPVPPGAATGEVLVTVSGQPSEGVEFEVTGTGGSGPAIGTLSPMLGLEGTVVTIRGANFGSTAEMGGVSFNGVWAAASSWSDEEIRVPVPADATTGNVVVTAKGQGSNRVAFIVADTGLGEPVIDSLSAASGPEGTVVTIEGSSFGPSIRALEGTSGVSFNGVWGEPTSWSETRIQVPVPPGAPSGLVTVAVAGEGSNGLAFVVERPAPLIEAVDASFGLDGTTVEITGRNFGPAMEAVQGWSGVSFDGLWGVPIYWSDRAIQVAAPAGVSGGLIVVASVGQESNGIPFTVAGAKTMSQERAVLASSVAPRAGPTLKSLDPDNGPVGTAVKIKGKNLGDEQGTSTVTFNGTEVEDYVGWANKRIDVEVPAGATTGPVVVTVSGVATAGIEFTVTAGTGPAISLLDPDSGPEGTSVEITGVNFGASQGTSTVSFNGVAGTATSWSDTSITAAVPMGATTGEVVVTVDGTASSGVSFTVAPAIGSLSPIAGPEGTSVEITGVNFGASQGTSTVTFNGTGARPTSWSDTSITVAVPAGATTGEVVVTVDGTASGGASFTVTPEIGSLSPVAGPEGTTVEITGTSFGAMQGTSTVTFNGTEAAPTNWSDTSITVTVPAGATTGPVVVTVGGEASNGVAFAVGSDPVISGLNPDSGPAGTTVEITGANFGASQGTGSVTFNGAGATPSNWSATSITVAVPGNATTGPVVVTVEGAASNAMTFSVKPVIGGLSRVSGPEGAAVVITGTGFGASQGTSRVSFNGTAATPSNWSDTSITVTVPANAATGLVVVTVGGTPSDGVTFTVTPAIGSLSPIAGPEGATVVITGTSFGAMQGTSTVSFNGTGATPTSWSPTSITVTVPVGATSGNVVVTVGGIASNGVSFTVGTDPIVTSLSPALGQVETTVVIGGVNFGASQGTSTVTFSGVGATAASWSDSSITVTVPASAATGPVVVTVGGEASNQVTFTVTGPPPEINKLKPGGGEVGDSVKVKGEHFGTAQGTSTVTFNGLKAAARKWDDDKITVNVPAGARTGPVVVTVEGQASNPVTFTVTGSSPSIISLDPASGEVETSVTITGVNFGDSKGTSTVTFNGVTVATYTSWSDTAITVPVPSTASTGPVVVTVAGQVSNGETFTVTVPVPSITGLNPTSGHEGASVVISGEDFGDTRGTSTVSFNGTAATAYTSWSDTSITATVPEGATTGDVVVTVGGQGSNGVSFTVEEIPVGVVVSPTTLDVTEGEDGTYQVKLASEPEADVTLTVASDNTDVTVSSGTLTFTTGNWDTAQTVTVEGQEDDDGVADEATITHTAASTDSEYDAISISSVEVSVTDNDPLGVTVTAETLDVTEGSTGTYEVKLDTLPSADVTVTVTEDGDNTDVTVSSGTLTFTTTSWNTAQTVTVTAKEDDDGVSETATITHTAASDDTSYGGISIGSVEVSVTDNDPLGVTVTAETLDIIEGEDGAYQVKLDTLPSAEVTVAVTSTDTGVVTVSSSRLTFTTSDWSDLQTVTVTAEVDDDYDNETATLTHTATSTDTNYDGITIGSVAVEVDDEDPPGVTVTAETLDITEGEDGAYQVKLDTEPEATVTVTVASDNTDVTLSSEALTFTTTSWNTAQTVTVTAEEDDDPDNETATITHTAASTDSNYGGITIGSVEVSVTDNDTPAVTVTPTTLEVDEGGTGTYEVKLGTLPEATVTVTEDSDNTDVTVSPATLTFTTTSWNTFQTVTVTAKEDDDDYADETATLTHTAASTDTNYNGSGITIGSVTVDVIDNDPPPITLSSVRTSVSEPSGTDTITASVPSGYAPEGDLTITLTHSGTAKQGTSADYTVGTLTITADQTSGTATLTVKDDSIDEDEETITLTGSGTGYADSDVLSIALEDDGDTAGIVVSAASLDVDEGATGQFQVKLNSEPLNNVTVSITEAADDASNAISVSGAPLTFTSSNWSTYQTVTVTAVEDDSDYADEEATITVSAASSDAKYDTASLNQTVDVNVIDNDPPPITLSSVRTSVSEPSGTDTITASVPSGYEPDADLTITLAHTGTAKHGTSADYTVGTLTILADSTSGTATLTVRDDSIDEDEETIALTGSGTGYGTSAALSIALEDDDTAGIVVSAASLDVTEGGTGQFQVKLNSEPLNNVTVSITEAADAISVSGAPLTFTSSNWSTYQTVTVTGVKQPSDFGNSDPPITVSAASSDAKYNTASLNQTVDVHVTNIDEARISLSSSETSVSEASGSRTATITATVPATAEPGGDLTIALAHSGTAGHGSSSDYTVGTLTITAGQSSGTATLTVGDDRIDEGSSETIKMTGSASGYENSDALSIPLNDDDTAGLVVSPTSLDITEGNDGTYRVKLNSQPTHNVSVGFSVSGSSTVTVPTSSLTFTTSNWNTNKTVTVRTAEDNSNYDDETATVTNSATSSDPKYNTASLNRTVDIDVDDDDTPQLALSCPSSVSEPSGSGTITVSRPSGYTPNVSTAVTLSRLSSSTAGTSDYTVASSLTIAANQMTSGGETLSVTDDRIDEGTSESIRLQASATGYDSGSCTITLNDNDTAGLVVSTSSLSLTEGNDGTYQVKLNSQPTHSVSVSFWMSLDSSSTVSVPTSDLTFTTSNWNTYKTVTVETAEDNSDYDNETATINNFPASSDPKYNSSLNKTVSVSVTDDDTPPLTLSCPSSVSEPSGTGTIRVSRPSGYRPSGSTGVSLTASGSAAKGTDYSLGSMSLTIPGGGGSASTTLTVIDDRIDEDAKSITLTARASGYVSDSCSITLNDNDTAGLVVTRTSLTIDEPMSGKYKVKLNSQPTATVTVGVSEDSDKIDAAATLSFSSNNWDTYKTVTVDTEDDGDCDNESATVSNKPTSTGDPKYNRPESLNKTVAVTVIDDESNTITLSSSPTSVSEESGKRTATITATLGCTSASEQTIMLNTSGTADENDDYTVGTLEVASGDLTGTATLTVQDDDVCEGAETIRLTGSTSGYTNSPLLSINLNDDDTAGIVVSPTSLTITEGNEGSYKVKLNSKPTHSVSVGFSVSGSSTVTVPTSSRSFTTSNWNTYQTVTVRTAEDNSDYSNESATITNSATSSDSKYNTTTINKTVSVSVTDDDTPNPSISSISPPLQPPDTEVTISGSNFGSSQGSVSFGSYSVNDISSWSNTSIRCFIPAFASAGTVSVKVTTSDGRMSPSPGYSYTITGQSPFRGECGEEEDCDEKPEKDDSEEGEGSDSEESEDPPGDGG